TVAPGSAYLRHVAAEAFKDLSQAKATLLNPFEREKYDAKLTYERGSKSTSSSTSSAPPPKQPSPSNTPGSSSRPQESRSTNQRSQSSARPRPQRPPLRIVLKPLASSLESFAFVILGTICIFFVGWLMASGRTPPWWAAGLTLALGVASFRHGLKPPTTTKVRSPLT